MKFKHTKCIRIENILYKSAFLSTSLSGSLSHKDLQSLQPIYLCKCDNLAREIPFHTLPCASERENSVYQNFRVKIILYTC